MMPVENTNHTAWEDYKEKRNKLAEKRDIASEPIPYTVRQQIWPPQEDDPVDHPTHYTSHPSGVEVIEITEHMNFCLGNAIKYILRAEHKGKQIEDLKKAAWYINREIARLENG